MVRFYNLGHEFDSYVVDMIPSFNGKTIIRKVHFVNYKTKENLFDVCVKYNADSLNDESIKKSYYKALAFGEQFMCNVQKMDNNEIDMYGNKIEHHRKLACDTPYVHEIFE